jgi:sugar phosphate isomerase/epimerase
MKISGISDEAGSAIETQIAAHKELGWRRLDLRTVHGVNITSIGQEEFERVCEALQAAGMEVANFASGICCWGRSVRDDFAQDVAELRRAIPRMQRLGTKLVRLMSFAVLGDREPEDQLEQERFRRLRELHRRFTAAGLTPVHENCMNYGGMGWTYTRRLLENVPGLKLVFDTGNPVFTPDYAQGKPWRRQSAWEFYEHVREHIAYIHIKDGIWDESSQTVTYTHAGEGQGDVRRILTDLFRRGYDGGISIEPHLAVVVHEDPGGTAADVRYRNYIEYGRRVEQLVAACRR